MKCDIVVFLTSLEINHCHAACSSQAVIQIPPVFICRFFGTVTVHQSFVESLLGKVEQVFFEVKHAKVEAVADWPSPHNITELQQSIGFANFSCQFIDHFSGKT
ncbi:uncharacterized protein VP01_4164g1 [Puccinia sorghi]|uniref:Uncharacterized protein n=1 Tax=Puccinia sorghi TaxID=27349 RepID=A0A0L6UQZ0_9BASI|nr:uncharacterized protein VP01_4164g1 [Puccinia sorghi]